MRAIVALALSFAVMVSFVVPALADDLHVKVVTASGSAGPFKLAVQTDPGATCGATAHWTGPKTQAKNDWSLATKKAGGDGMVEWANKAPNSGKIFFAIDCKLGDKEGKASAEVQL